MQVAHTRRTYLRAALSWAAGAAMPAVATEFTPWQANKPLPPLDLVDLGGRRWTSASLRGRAVLLNFWASWCEPCRAEMPTLQQLGEFYGDKQLVVLAVNFKESRLTAAGYARRTGMALPIVLDAEGKFAAQCGVRAFPTTIGLSAGGVARWRMRGEFDWSTAQAGRQVESLFQ
ncbi:TlpA family protein disulfide reductase [Caenimonas koreensis]|uniref:TlpA family protein disulfide reductase n=1 Tax=Caenimonas koreensis TaxID=367474 RepID=UPI003783E8FA